MGPPRGWARGRTHRGDQLPAGLRPRRAAGAGRHVRIFRYVELASGPPVGRFEEVGGGELYGCTVDAPIAMCGARTVMELCR